MKTIYILDNISYYRTCMSLLNSTLLSKRAAMFASMITLNMRSSSVTQGEVRNTLLLLLSDPNFRLVIFLSLLPILSHLLYVFYALPFDKNKCMACCINMWLYMITEKLGPLTRFDEHKVESRTLSKQASLPHRVLDIYWNKLRDVCQIYQLIKSLAILLQLCIEFDVGFFSSYIMYKVDLCHVFKC